MMNQNFKKILVLIIILLAFLGFKLIQAALYVENKLIFKGSESDNMFTLTRATSTYTVSVGTDDSFVIKNTSSVVIFKIDGSGNFHLPLGTIEQGISLSDITNFPADCPVGQFIYGIDTDTSGDLLCRTP